MTFPSVDLEGAGSKSLASPLPELPTETLFSRQMECWAGDGIDPYVDLSLPWGGFPSNFGHFGFAD